MAARGLGKGLDSLIPNALGETKTKKRSSSQSKKRSNNGRKGTADPCENYKGRAKQRTAS